MNTFFRVQGKGYSFEEMQQHQTQVDVDDFEAGLCVSTSPDGYDGGSQFGGAYDAMDDDDDLVILEGKVIREIYDGVVIIPTREIARFTIAEWDKMLESGEAWEYEQ